MLDWQETKEQTDLQKSAVRLRRHRTLSPTERPRHFSTPGSMETGRTKTADTRHTLAQFGDRNGPSRPLSSVCVQGTVIWEPIWRGLAFQTLPCVSTNKLTKPKTTSFSPAQNVPRDISLHGRIVLIWWPSCGARQKTYAGRLVLWHQPDWRSDLHSCRSLKKKKKLNSFLCLWWCRLRIKGSKFSSELVKL